MARSPPKFRPGHADLTYHLKYGIRDYRGGGRSSARETAARVAAGGVARAALAALAPEVRIRGALVQIGDRSRSTAPPGTGTRFRETPSGRPDPRAAEAWATYLDGLRKSGNSVGAVIELVAEGVPAGLGAPIYAKLDSDIAMALMTINAVKGVEIGAGMAAAALTGSENADEIFMGNDGVPASPPTTPAASSAASPPARTSSPASRSSPPPRSSPPAAPSPSTGEETEIVTKGRHDPCVGIRAVPVGEAMLACVILDHFLLHRGQVGDAGGRIG